MTTIDAHHHFWDPQRGDYGWLTPDLAHLYRSFGPADLAPELDACGVLGTVVVQAAATEAECDYLLGIAARTRWVFGVVGWLDLRSRSAPERIASRAGLPKFVGVRPMLQDEADIAWITSPGTAPAFRALAEHGLAFDALIRVPQAAHVAALAARNPDLKIVIDHGAKPDIAGAERTRWAAAMRELARHPNVHCKYSGLLTEAGTGAGAGDLRFYAQMLLDLYGPSRLIWGSDWPVVLGASSYRAWIGMARDLMSEAPPESREAIMGGNAVSFYGLRPDE
ncbi:MAG TPA: amidohydrolase family protein [Steroidobacteraceae bacterium]|nr:amidohydrolase family protein [Steroidobacteraceae bacterium]